MTTRRARLPKKPKKIECHQGLHADCSGGYCSCECHKRKRSRRDEGGAEAPPSPPWQA